MPNKIAPDNPNGTSNGKSALTTYIKKLKPNFNPESAKRLALKSYTPIIEIRHGFKHYSFYNLWNPVLRDFNLKIYPGEIYAILGPRSSGKTTISRVLIGIIKLNQGEIRITDRNFSIPLYNCKVGYMPQNLSLDLCLTISETFAYYGHLFHLPNAYTQKRKLELCKLLDMPDHNKKLSDIDENIYQRLTFALAILQEPELLIMDEPTQGINPKIIKVMWNMLKGLSKTLNSTIILTTINSTEAQKADRVGILYGGQIIVEGNPQLLVTRNNLTHLEEVYAKSYTYERHYLVRNVSINEGKESVLSTNSHSFNIRGTSIRDITMRNIIQYDMLAPTKKTIFLRLLQKICNIFKINTERILWVCWIDYKRTQRSWFTILLVELFLMTIALIYSYLNNLSIRTINVAVFNGDIEGYYVCNRNTSRLISCQILQRFDPQLIDLTFLDSLEKLNTEKTLGSYDVYLTIPNGFTKKFYQEMTSQLYYQRERLANITDTSIRVFVAALNMVAKTVMKRELKSIRKIIFDEIVLQHPLNSEDYPIKIVNNVPLIQANLLCLATINAYCHYSTIFSAIYYKLYERDLNLGDIKRISGVKALESVIAISLSFGIYTVVKCLSVSILLFYFNDIEVNSRWDIYTLILMFQIFMSYGLGVFLVATSREMVIIILLLIGYCFTINYLGGVLTITYWYNKRLHKFVIFMKQFTSFLWVNEACQAVFFKNGSLYDSVVYLCIVVNFFLGVFHLILAKILNPITFRRMSY